jgi:hypothetical protein
MNAFEPQDPSWIDAQGEPFEEAWERGERPRIEDYLAGLSGPARADLLRHLLLIELQRRRGSGDQPSPAEYRVRFPEHGGLIADCLDERGHAPGGSPESANGREEKVGGPAQGKARDPDRTGPYQSARSDAADLPVRAGRYWIEGEIGQGGMGQVLRARDPDLNRPLAVKVLLKQHQGQADLARRFLVEAQVTGQLQHPGIPPVHDGFRLADDQMFHRLFPFRLAGTGPSVAGGRRGREGW